MEAKHTPDQAVVQRIDEICRTSEARLAACSTLELDRMDMLTADERAELHTLKMQLPTFADERAAAREQIAERIKHRRGKATGSAA